MTDPCRHERPRAAADAPCARPRRSGARRHAASASSSGSCSGSASRRGWRTTSCAPTGRFPRARRQGSARSARKDPTRKAGESRRRRPRKAALRLLQDPARRRGAQGPGGGKEVAGPRGRRPGEGRDSRTSAPKGARQGAPTRRAEKVATRGADARPPSRPSASGCRRARSPTETDAENLKARLAFAGWQASIQQGTLPDKGDALSRPPRPLRQHRRANRIKQRSREERLRRRRHQVLNPRRFADRPLSASRTDGSVTDQDNRMALVVAPTTWSMHAQ